MAFSGILHTLDLSSRSLKDADPLVRWMEEGVLNFFLNHSARDFILATHTMRSQQIW